jgi:hypothetical protein
MAGGFVKLYGSLLLGSSLMDESIEARWLFVCFLAAADEHGFVRCQTAGNAARIANLTLDQAGAALKALSSPDPESTTQDKQGRRLIRSEGGWNVVNYNKYREMRTEGQIKAAERQANWRASQSVTCHARHARETKGSASLSVVPLSVSVEEEQKGQADQRPADAQVRGSNFREACDLEVKILQAVRQISERTGKPAWEVSRKVTSYKRRDGTMSPGVEDPARLGSILARQKALEDCEWWIGEMDKADTAKGTTNGA